MEEILCPLKNECHDPKVAFDANIIKSCLEINLYSKLIDKAAENYCDTQCPHCQRHFVNENKTDNKVLCPQRDCKLPICNSCKDKFHQGFSTLI